MTPKGNARGDRPDIDLGGPMLMEPSIHAPTNALPASVELYDSGNNVSIQQASHQGWPSVEDLREDLESNLQCRRI